MTTPARALSQLMDKLTAVPTEQVPIDRAVSRVLAQTILANRDSPACDVSAMDGYALRLSDVLGSQQPGALSGTLPVAGEVGMGKLPGPLRKGHAMRVFTGGAIPAGADAVIRREQTDESADTVAIHREAGDLRVGANIRKQGENVHADDVVLRPGVCLTAAAMSAMATFGVTLVQVHRPLRVGVIVTGSELHREGRADGPIGPACIHDANGPGLLAMFQAQSWIDTVGLEHVSDERAALFSVVDATLAQVDALLLTGGVSMGDHDDVPAVLHQLGCQTMFHRLPQRPGKPLLGAIGPDGQAVLGLPGNPVSALVTARRFAVDALAHRAGLQNGALGPTRVALDAYDGRVLPLWWYRPVHRVGPGLAKLVEHRGSGDIANLASSDGFIEVPPNTANLTDALYWSWQP